MFNVSLVKLFGESIPQVEGDVRDFVIWMTATGQNSIEDGNREMTSWSRTVKKIR